MTNSSLIAVFNGTIANQSVQLANAQALHSFLEVQSKFADWIKNRISDYGFVQDEDYIIVTERTNGRPRKEYHITLDMGKELAMVERNEKGRQIRKYFIECERQVLQNSTALVPATVTPEQQQAIQSAVQQAHHRTGLHWQEIYRQLKSAFHVAKYDQIPADQYGNVMAFLMNLQPIALPVTEKKYRQELTKDEWLRFASMWFALYNTLDLLSQLEQPLRAIGSHFGTTAYTHATEYKNTLCVMKRILEPMLTEFDVHPYEDGHYFKALKTLREYQPHGLGRLVNI